VKHVTDMLQQGWNFKCGFEDVSVTKATGYPSCPHKVWLWCLAYYEIIAWNQTTNADPKPEPHFYISLFISWITNLWPATTFV